MPIKAAVVKQVLEFPGIDLTHGRSFLCKRREQLGYERGGRQDLTCTHRPSAERM